MLESQSDGEIKYSSGVNGRREVDGIENVEGKDGSHVERARRVKFARVLAGAYLGYGRNIGQGELSASL